MSTESYLKDNPQLAAVRDYWDEHIHDLAVAQSPVGTASFFKELDRYRFEKLHYLPRLVNFANYNGREVLEVGCGVGIDLIRFAQAGAKVTGVDLAPVSIELAQQNFAQHGLTAALQVMNGENLTFADNSFDAVYAHGVIQYTANAPQLIAELHRVLRPNGQAILMVYNRYSWLTAVSKITNVDLEHEDAPVFHTYSIKQFKQLLQPFAHYKIIPERFPVPTALHHGLKAKLYNGVFVKTFNLLPKAWIRPLGWHLMTFAYK